MNRSCPNAVWLSLMTLRSLLRRSSVADRLILFSDHPQAVQEHRELARYGNHRTLLRGFAASLRELLTEATKLRIWCQ